MKGIKKLLSIVLCIVLSFAALPIAAAEPEEDSEYYTYTVTDGKATITGFYTTFGGVKTVPDTIDGYPITSIGDSAFYGNTAIMGIILPNSIISIGNRAFFQCYGLEQVIMSDGVSIIGDEAFSDCFNITDVFMPNSVTEIGENAFGTSSYLKLRIYYCGTEAEWDSIDINSKNPTLSEAEIFFHNYESIYTAPTCKESGYTEYTCSICSHSYTEADTESGLLPHDYSEEFTVDKEADDFEAGSMSRHCKNCTAFTDVTVIPRTSIAHGSYSEAAEWVIKKDGTLVILGSGAIDDYKLPVFTPWYEYSESVTALSVSEDITKLGNNSFSSLEKLAYAVINNPDTEFGVYVFANNSNLKIECYDGSTAVLYAKENGHGFVLKGAPSAPIIEGIVGNIATVKALDGYEYSTDSVHWQKSNVFTIPKNEIVFFYQRIAESEASAASPASEAAKGISVAAPEVVFTGYNEIYIKPTENFEYGLENTIWQSENKFSKWIVPEETYTVFQRYKATEDVFSVYDTNGAAVTVNGNNKPTETNAEYLIWLRKLLFTFEESNNFAADVNEDFSVDILDLIALKNQLLQK